MNGGKLEVAADAGLSHVAHVEEVLLKAAARNVVAPAAGRHGRFVRHIAALGTASERFAAQLEIGEAWWHHLVYLTCDMLGETIVRDPLYYGDFFAGAPATDIAVEAIGYKLVGLMTALRKLRTYPLPPGCYARLVELLRDSGRARILLHRTTITLDNIDVAHVLTDNLVCGRTPGAFENRDQAESFQYLVDTIMRLFPAEDHVRIVQSAREIERFRDVHKWYRRWLERAAFPTPPWSGNALLQPLATPAVLNETAGRFRNCLRQHIPPIIAGLEYFYEWRGGVPIVAGILRDPVMGWVLFDMQGANNNLSITAEIRDDIREQFANAGIRWRPPVGSANLWFDPFTLV